VGFRGTFQPGVSRRTIPAYSGYRIEAMCWPKRAVRITQFWAKVRVEIIGPPESSARM